MASNTFPSREPEFLTWSKNLAQLLTSAPAEFGATIEQAASYSAAQEAFASSYQRANDPVTRSPANIEVKNMKKDELVVQTQAICKILQASPVMDNGKRRALGITIRQGDTPINPPADRPFVEITSVDGWTVNLRLGGGEGMRRKKPAGVSACYVFSFVGEQPPAGLSGWKFDGGTSRTTTSVTFPTAFAPGTKVWITACWINAKQQSGPACAPMGTQINFGSLAKAA